MRQYRCEECGFRVLSDDEDEVIHFARYHADEKHSAVLSQDDARAELDEVEVAGPAESAEEEEDESGGGLGPVRTDRTADEW